MPRSVSGSVKPKRKAKRPATKLRAPKSDKSGRSLYEPRFAEVVENLTLLGATDLEISRVIGIEQGTFIDWKNRHPDLAAAHERGKMQADGNVANRLYQRAMGYKHTVQKIVTVDGKPTIMEIEEKLPPEVVACIFWLKNRQREKWRDRFDHTVRRIGGAQDLTDEELAALAKDGEEAAQAASTRH